MDSTTSLVLVVLTPSLSLGGGLGAWALGLVQPSAAPQNLEKQVLSGLLGTQTSQDSAQVSSSVNNDELLSVTIKSKQYSLQRAPFNLLISFNV